MNHTRRELLLLSLTGQDRPGLLDAVAQALSDLDGSWLESRIVRLDGYFTGLLRVSIGAQHSAGLEQALQNIDGLQSQIIKLLTTEDSQKTGADEDLSATLELTGYDRPGIVRTVTRLLMQQGVDIETFESELRRAPMSGDPTFYARVHLRIPKMDSPDELARALERLGTDLMVDVQVDVRP